MLMMGGCNNSVMDDTDNTVDGTSQIVTSNTVNGTSQIVTSESNTISSENHHEKVKMKSYSLKPKIVNLDKSEIKVKEKYDVQAFSKNNIYAIRKNENGNFTLCQNEKEICEYDFDLGFAPDLVINNLFFSLKGVEDENGTMNISLIVYNLKTNEKKVVYSAPLTNYRSYLYQLNNSEIMFSYNGIENDVRYEYTGVYNFKEDECSIISKHKESVWDDSLTTEQEITSVSAYDDKIYFAKEQRIDGNTAVFLTCLDSLGNVLYEDRVKCLDKYAHDGVNIQYIDVLGNYIFISYYGNGEAEIPKPVIVKKTEDGYFEVSTDSEIYFFKRRISENLIDNKYVLFAAAPNKNGEYIANLIAYDITNDSYLLIKYDMENNIRFNTLADTDGNLLIYYIDDNSVRHYFSVNYSEWASADFNGL